MNSDWPTRYRMFLRTHRGTLNDCEQFLRWATHTLSGDFDTEWAIEIGQSDDEPIQAALWSHVQRDCHVMRGGDGERIELNDGQLKLVREIHTYFMPHYREDARRYDAVVQELWRNGGLVWHFAVPKPSAHERLEARLRLREWLQGKVAPSEIQALLDETKGC